uniref:EF-hand domain-containing protein n=1 Tax=Natrinema halophilum TaxID=1699371 RepID=A0A7D5KT97_9EURY
MEIGKYEIRDTTGDGLYNDFTGDGETTHEDVEAFLEHLRSDGVQNNPEKFDFSGNGQVDGTDVLELLRQV